LRALRVREPECSIAHHRTAERQPELMLVERIRAGRERALRVEPIVAEELVGAAGQRVRPRLRDNADRAARRATELGVAAGGDDLGLARRVLDEIHVSSY